MPGPRNAPLSPRPGRLPHCGVTYCLSLRLEDGLVFLADTRTNAGVDNVSTYRKLHLFQPAPDRLFVLQSAGNLATTQEVLDRINHDLGDPGATESLATVQHLFEAALYVGRLSQQVAANHRQALGAVGADGTATFLLGGEIRGDEPDILLVYPEGNYIRASDERPFLQIGESKYGKFTLELAVTSGVSLETATKIALDLDDEHGRGQRLGRTAVRRADLSQRLVPADRGADQRRLAVPGPAARRLGAPPAGSDRRPAGPQTGHLGA